MIHPPPSTSHAPVYYDPSRCCHVVTDQLCVRAAAGQHNDGDCCTADRHNSTSHLCCAALYCDKQGPDTGVSQPSDLGLNSSMSNHRTSSSTRDRCGRRESQRDRVNGGRHCDDVLGFSLGSATSQKKRYRLEQKRDVCPCKVSTAGCILLFWCRISLNMPQLLPVSRKWRHTLGLKQQERCACFEIILGLKNDGNHCLIINRVTPLHEGQWPDKPAQTSPPVNLLRFLLHLVLYITAR